MNKESIRIAQDIAKTNPTILIIKGNTDPTYSSNCFFEVLINGDKIISLGHHRKTSIWLDSINHWIIDTIKMIQSDYEIIKFYNTYVVGNYSIENTPDYDEDYGVIVDFGGIIEIEN